MNPKRTILLIVCLTLFIVPASLQAQQEKILSFDSHINIFADGNVVVTETIRVVSAGKKIRRGIYRDFPTRYRIDHGSQVKVRFEVLERHRQRVGLCHRKGPGSGPIAPGGPR